MERAEKSNSHLAMKQREEYFGHLAAAIQEHCNEATVQERIKGKGKGKEVLHRLEGEVLNGGAWTSVVKLPKGNDHPMDYSEDELLKSENGVQWVREKLTPLEDPRKTASSQPSRSKFRPLRNEFYAVKYEVRTEYRRMITS
jgi:hypothetical protein